MSHLYLIACEDDAPIKIGISKNIDKRFSALQTGFPYKLFLKKKWPLPSEKIRLIEGIAHDVLEEYRMSGEWFSCGADEAANTIDEMIRESKCGDDIEAYEDFIIRRVRRGAAKMLGCAKVTIHRRLAEWDAAKGAAA